MMRLRPITVLIADDDPVVREGLAAILEGQADLAVVGEARDGEEALEMAQRLHPAVVLTDVWMPRLDGIEATRRIKHLLPEVAVIFLTIYSHHLTEALAAGGCRYLLKGCRVEELLSAIRGSCVERSSEADPPA